jgi:hypothetical protein
MKQFCRWTTCPDDQPSSLQIDVLKALRGLSHFQDFQLTLSHGKYSYIPLGRLSDLKKISLVGIRLTIFIKYQLAKLIGRSPKLAYLHVDSPISYSENISGATFHDFLSDVPRGSLLRLTHLTLHGTFTCIDSVPTLPHIGSLSSLNLHSHPLRYGVLERPSGYSTTSEIYAKLKMEKIHLKRVVSGEANDAILDYLGSYSGLEALELGLFYFGAKEESDALSDRFYKSVLPKHFDTIRELKIQPSYEGGWCYDADFVSVLLAQCKKLRSLSVTLNSAAAIMSNQTTAIQTPTHFWLEVHEYRDNFDSVVCSDNDFMDDSQSYSSFHP